jgi:hypothetical protein
MAVPFLTSRMPTAVEQLIHILGTFDVETYPNRTKVIIFGVRYPVRSKINLPNMSNSLIRLLWMQSVLQP